MNKYYNLSVNNYVILRASIITTFLKCFVEYFLALWQRHDLRPGYAGLGSVILAVPVAPGCTPLYTVILSKIFKTYQIYSMQANYKKLLKFTNFQHFLKKYNCLPILTNFVSLELNNPF